MISLNSNNSRLKIVSRDEILKIKEERRKSLDLEYHCNGDCIHIGKISRGCKSCFIRSNFTSFAVYTGCECNVACGYCYYDKGRTDSSWKTVDKIKNSLADFYALTLDPKAELTEISYNSWGETLRYPEIIREASNILERYERASGRRVYSHLYTNGMLADEEMLRFLKSCNITELRFHISASNFSKTVLENMVTAKSLGFIVAVEEPSLPENKEKITKLLPFFNEVGLDHLDLVECQVTPFNIDYLSRTYPNGRIYRDLLWHLYDEGMSYDIMEERLKNNYKFSVIDCNSRVEGCRGSHQVSTPELIDWSCMDNAIKDFQ